MSELVRVTVAPGNVLTVVHPSGIPGLPRLDLFEGECHTVGADQAARLYRDGMILHPVTGQPPQPRAMHDPVLQIVTDGRSYEDLARLAHKEAPPPGDDYWAKNPTFNVVPNSLTSINGIL